MRTIKHSPNRLQQALSDIGVQDTHTSEIKSAGGIIVPAKQDLMVPSHGNVIGPRGREVAPNVLPNHTRLKGRFRIEKRTHGMLVQDTGWFDNLILNQGLDYIGAPPNNSPTNYCHLGTGNSVPSATQTQLDAFVGSAQNAGQGSYTNSGTPNYIGTTTVAYAFNQGSVVGNLAEVGIGSSPTTGGLFSRTLITDSNGNPITLTATSIDQITVYWSLSFIPSTTGTAGSVLLNGVNYTFTAYQMGATTFGNNGGYRWDMYPGFYPFAAQIDGGAGRYIVTHAAGTPLSPTVLTDQSVPNSTGSNTYSNFDGSGNDITWSVTAYSGGSFTRTSTFSIKPRAGNMTGGIQCIQVQFAMVLSYGGYYNMVLYYFDTPIPKTNTYQLQLTFQGSWSN